MKKYSPLCALFFLISCSQKMDRLDESYRNYESLVIPGCYYQSNDIFLLNELNFDQVNEELKTFSDSILGVQWSEAIHDDMTDSLGRCVFLMDDSVSISEFYQLDSSELFNAASARILPGARSENLIFSGGDSFTYFPYEDYSVSLTFRICFDEAIAYKGRVYERTKMASNNSWSGSYRNAYEVDLAFMVDFRINPPSPIVGSKKMEYYRLTLYDTCTLLRDELSDDLLEDFL